MTKRKSNKGDEGTLFPGKEEIADPLLSLVEKLKSLTGPLSRLEKVLRRTHTRSEDYPWPEAFSCLISARKAWEAHATSIPKNLDKATSNIRERLSQERSALQQRFLEEVAQRDWTMQGNWPEPIIEQVIFVKVDPDRGKAMVNGRPLASLSLDQLLKAIERERNTLFWNDFDPTRWLVELLAGYDKAKILRALPDGEPISVFDILAQMVWARQGEKFFHNPSVENFLAYSVAQFRADLTRTLASGVTETPDGRRLEISAGSFAKHTIFMYFPTTRHLGSCGRIAFSRKGRP